VEGERYTRGDCNLFDTADVEVLFHAATDHGSYEPMHVPYRGSQNVDSRGFDKMLGVSDVR
jgi:hypothetical protein